MNKEDKAFIREALNDLKTDLGGRMDRIENEVGGLKTEVQGLKGKVGDLKVKVEGLTEEVHCQGVMLEQMKDQIGLVAENTVGLNRRVTVLEERVGV